MKELSRMTTLETIHNEFMGNCDYDSAMKILDKYAWKVSANEVKHEEELNIRGYYFHNPKQTKK